MSEQRWTRWVAIIMIVLAMFDGEMRVAGIFEPSRLSGMAELFETAAKEEGMRLAEVGTGARERGRTRRKAEKAAQAEAERLAALGQKKLVALTFDDGPSRATTPRLLDILKTKGVKATFFVVGSMVNGAPEVLKREVAEGHEVGGHTTAHLNLSTMSGAAIQGEMAAMEQLLTGVMGRGATIMRPPYGAMSEAVKRNVGMPMVIWTVDTLDWKNRDAGMVRQGAVGAAFDGAIILMHDIHPTTVDAVAGIIDDLRAQGYELVTVSEMAAARGVRMAAGGVYGGFRP